MDPIKVLLVIEVPLIGSIFSSVLTEEQDIEVAACVSSAEGALAFLQQQSVDVVVVSIGLPAEPLIASNYEAAKLLPITEAALSAGFEAVDDKRWAARLPTLRRAINPGDALTFKFKGTRCAIYDLLGPDLGQVAVSLDGAPPKIVSRFDGFSTYHRLGTLLVGTELADVEHTVKIEIHPEPPDKAAILAKRQEKMDKPERFQGTCFYPGAILLVGELVK